MTIEIRGTAIQNIVNGLKVKEENKKYWKGLVECAKRDEKSEWMAKDFEAKYEMYRHEMMSAYQVLAELNSELYETIKNEVEAD